MAWNLTDTLDTDLTKDKLFDDLPENSVKLAGQAKVPSAQKIVPPPSLDNGPVISRPAQLNGSTDIGQSEVLAPPKDVKSLVKSEGVFDSLPPVNERVVSPFKESDLPVEVPVPANGRVNGTQRELTLGESFQKAKGVLQQMDAYHKAHNYGKAQDKGINTAQYEAAKNHVMSQLGDFIENTHGIAKTDVPSLFVGLTKTAAGFRTAQEIDEIHDIVKNGAVYTNLQGEQVSLPRNSNWGNALAAYDDRFTANIHKKPEKPVEDKTVEKTTAFIASMNSALGMPETTPAERALKQTIISTLKEKGNEATGGKFYQALHVDMENKISTSLASADDRNKNYMGFLYNSPEAKADPNGQQSGNDFLIKATEDGSLPTITVGKDGEMNTSMADAYLEKHGVDSTPAGIWNSQTGLLEMFRYDRSKDKNNLLTAMKVKGPEVAKKSVDGNPYRAEADEDKAAEVAGRSKDRLSKIDAEMTELEERRTLLKGQRNETKKPFPALQRFPGAISAEKAADKYDAITGKMQKLNEEKQKLLGAWVPTDKDLRTDGFDPEGSGYDIKTAVAAGMEPDSKTKHWGSVRKSTPDEIKKYGVPEDSYLLLKGAKHPTHNLAVEYEAQRGFEIKKIGDRYFSIPVNK